MARLRRTLLLALTALAAAAALASAAGLPAGPFKGKTAQKRAVTLVVATKKGTCTKAGATSAPCVTSVRWTALYRCRATDGSTGRPGPQPTVLGGGEIVKGVLDAPFGDSSDDVHLHVTFKGRRATGWFTETYKQSGGVNCRSGKVTFSARR